MENIKIFFTIMVIAGLLTVSMSACKIKPTGSGTSSDSLITSTASSENETSNGFSSGDESNLIQSNSISGILSSNYISSANSSKTSQDKSSALLSESASGVSSVSSGEEQPTPTTDPGSTVLSASLTNSGKKINNMFNHYETWYGADTRGGQLAGLPENGIKNEFPFVEYVTLVPVSGGSDKLDLYADVNDPSKGMNFTNFNAEIASVLKQGVLPYLVLCNVPNALCNDAKAGVMGPNLRPPTTTAQWNLYYDYIKAIAQNCADTFGLAAIRKWQWGSFTEANNSDYFSTSDGNKTNTRNAYFKLYDYTVAALQSVMGKDQFEMGTHLLGHISMQNFSFVAWDELEFIDHCASGTNYYTGGKGTQLDFLAVTHYDGSPGNSAGVRTLTEIAKRLRDRAVKDGLTIDIAVDDYGQINDQTGKELAGSRTIGLSWGTSKIASDFKELLASDYSYLGFWTLSSSCYDWRGAKNNFLSGARVSQANVAELAYKMVGSTLLTTNKSGETAYRDDKVDAVISYNESKNTAYALVYNHNEKVEAVTKEDVSINISNISAKSGTEVTIKRYILDSTHSNWFNVWWKERGKTAAINFSPYDVVLPTFLKYAKDIAYWYENLERYTQIGEIGAPQTTMLTPSNNKITLKTTMTHHSVVLYEITNAKIS